ncbi:30S ribosomal protein S15 [Candidatus Micrarchaeota archaeon]|nr:30S ribosomal protein S15 [Candidatus Micrarchaeota archaeon]
MARLHTRKKGKSKSRKPAVSEHKWVEFTSEEVVSFIENLAKEGKSEAGIGLILRDQYGIPNVRQITGKTINQLLVEKKLAPKYPSDLVALLRRAVRMMEHLKSNPQDKTNRIKLSHVESKIKRLVRYYRGNKLPADWRYDPEAAALIVK